MSVAIGALSKKDTDALVMHLLDKFGLDEGPPLASYPNQDVSALLRVPASRVRQLRYEAGLKYGGRVEAQAKARLLVALSRAVLEVESKTICLVIEDALAKNWLQGQLKNSGLIFDHSFNSEIIKVRAEGLFHVLGQLFDKTQTEAFAEAFDKLTQEKKSGASRGLRQAGRLVRGRRQRGGRRRRACGIRSARRLTQRSGRPRGLRAKRSRVAPAVLARRCAITGRSGARPAGPKPPNTCRSPCRDQPPGSRRWEYSPIRTVCCALAGTGRKRYITNLPPGGPGGQRSAIVVRGNTPSFHGHRRQQPALGRPGRGDARALASTMPFRGRRWRKTTASSSR